MTVSILNAAPNTTVADGGTWVVAYPSGMVANDFVSTGAKLSDGNNVYSATVSLGASGATVTNPTGRSIPAGSAVKLELVQDDMPAVLADSNPLTGRVSSLSAGSEVISPYAAFTWAGKPLATAWPVGVPIIITDVGNSAAGSLWVTDGTNWRPANGRVSLASRSGSVATPIATISASASGKFTLPENIKIPAGCIVHGQTTLEVVVTMRRKGTAGTNQFIVYVGSANSTSDSASIATTTTATNNQDCSLYPVIGFPSSGTMMTSSWSGVANTTAGTDNVDRTTNINTAVDMFVNFGVFSGNVADSYDLLAYRVAIVF